MDKPSFGRTIQLFLVNGTPSGLRKATIHGWTGIVFVCGASSFSDMTAREEVDRTGVYILAGPDPEKNLGMRVYIGSGNSVSERIKQSALKRDFWEIAIAVTTSDDDLSKGHVEYIESRLIDMTAMAGRMVLDNATLPEIARRRLPEADRANMEQFLSNLSIVLPVIGIEMLKPQPRAVVETEAPIQDRIRGEAVFEIRHKSNIYAEAVEENSEFVVLEGSQVLMNTGFVQQSYSSLKQKLLEDGVLVPDGSDKLKFAKPYTFNSPSAASAIILDRNSNGRTEWKVKGEKQSYHDWHEIQATQREEQR